MPTPPLLLLPPSEGKAAGGSGPAPALASLSFEELTDHRTKAIASLTRAMKGSEAARSKLLGVKGTALAAATAANRSLLTSPTMPAIERYTGVLYDALDVASLTARDRRRLDSQVVIFSGLWGMVSPADPIPDYKLKMGATFPSIGKLATWWRPAISDALAAKAAGATVWNLLPNEHAAAWAPAPVGSPAGPAAILSVKFLDEAPSTDGERSFTTVNHWNKLLKGALVRYVLATGADEPAALTKFRHPEGYRYDRTLTVTTDSGIVISMVRPVR